MKKKKTGLLLAIALVCVMALTAIPFSACPAPTTPTPTPYTPTPATPTPTTPVAPATYDWKFSQPYPEGCLLYDVAEYFIEEMDSLSDGRMQIRHYPAELLGGYEVVQQGVATGDIDFCITWPTPAMSSKWDMYWIGGLVYNWDQSVGMYGPDGWLTAIYSDIAEESNWHMMGALAQAGDDIQSIKPYDIPANPDGLKIRVQASAQKHAMYRCQGYSPVTMPMSEVSSSLALGTIDAACGIAPPEFRVYGDSFNYVYAVHDLWACSTMAMNLDLWNSLPAADQAIITEASEKAMDKGLEWTLPHIRADWDDLYDFQVIVSVDGDAWAEMARAIRTCAWPDLEPQIGSELLDMLQAHAVDLPYGMTSDQMGYVGDICSTEWIEARQPNMVYHPEDLWPGAPGT